MRCSRLGYFISTYTVNLWVIVILCWVAAHLFCQIQHANIITPTVDQDLAQVPATLKVIAQIYFIGAPGDMPRGVDNRHTKILSP